MPKRPAARQQPDIKAYHAGRAIPPGNGNITMISAADAANITIEGNGTIDGNGAKFYTGQGDNTCRPRRKIPPRAILPGPIC